MSAVNKAIVIGNVGQDPKIRTSQSGGKIASFSLATSEVWKDKATGERKERTQWHRVVVFNEALAKVVEQYVKKGSKLYVEGAMQTRSYTENGTERFVTEIIVGPFHSQIQMLDRRPGEPPPADGPEQYGTASSAQPDMNDEIPF